MTQPERFPLVQTGTFGGRPDLAPMLPVTLGSPHGSVQATGLLDSGATINVLPHDLGIQLGLDWRQQQRYGIQLTGNLANYHARGVALDLVIGPFPAVRQVFAWTQATNVPLILGRIHFFLEFEVCFFRAKAYFEVQPKQ